MICIGFTVRRLSNVYNVGRWHSSVVFLKPNITVTVVLEPDLQSHTEHYMELESTLIKMKEKYLIFIYFINSHICYNRRDIRTHAPTSTQVLFIGHKLFISWG